MTINFGGREITAGEELYGVLLEWIAGLDMGTALSLSNAIERRIPWVSLSPNLRAELDNFGASILDGDE